MVLAIFSKEREPRELDTEVNKLGSISLLASQDAVASHCRVLQHFPKRIDTPPFPTSSSTRLQVGAVGEGRYMHNRSQNGTEGGSGSKRPVSQVWERKDWLGGGPI